MFEKSVLGAYPARATLAAWAFLNAIRPQASWSSARWFSGFFDQRFSAQRVDNASRSRAR
jgi:hypothetical protein